jgi:hypothetical protein
MYLTALLLSTSVVSPDSYRVTATFSNCIQHCVSVITEVRSSLFEEIVEPHSNIGTIEKAHIGPCATYVSMFYVVKKS